MLGVRDFDGLHDLVSSILSSVHALIQPPENRGSCGEGTRA
jgi:hypothetical protein